MVRSNCYRSRLQPPHFIPPRLILVRAAIPGSAMPNPAEVTNMALFCDFENVALGVQDAKYDKFDIGKVIERLLLKGSIVVKKAYCDWERYKDRNLAERFWAKAKQYRRVATRYDKKAQNFMAFVHVAAVMILLR